MLEKGGTTVWTEQGSFNEFKTSNLNKFEARKSGPRVAQIELRTKILV